MNQSEGDSLQQQRRQEKPQKSYTPTDLFLD